MARTLSNTPAAVYQRQRRERLAREAAAAPPPVDPRAVAAANLIATRYRERLAARYTQVPGRLTPTVNVTSFTGVTRALRMLRPAGASNVQIIMNDRRVPGRRIIMRRFPLNRFGAAMPAERYNTSVVNFNYEFTQVIIDAQGEVEESFKIDDTGSRTVRAGSYSYSFYFGGTAAADWTRETTQMIDRIQTISYKSKNENCVLACMQALYGRVLMCAKVGAKLSTPDVTHRVAPSKLFKTIREMYKLPKGPIAVSRARHIIEDLDLGAVPIFADSELREIDGDRLLTHQEAEAAQSGPGIFIVHKDHCTRFIKITNMTTCIACQRKYVKLDGHDCKPGCAKVKEALLPNSTPRATLICYDLETRSIRNKYTSSYNLDANGKVVGPPMLEYEQQATCLSFWGREGDAERVTMEAATEILDDRCYVGIDCVERFLDWLYDEAFCGRPKILKAHNASRFDSFFVIQTIQSVPKFASHFKYKDIITKGSKVVTFSWLGHEFQDSSLHLTGKLETVCANYKAPIQKQKSTSSGADSMELCLRYPTLGPQDFLGKLSHDELREYKTYCLIDSVALFQTMRAYDDSMRTLIYKLISPDYGPVTKKNTNRVTKILLKPTAPGVVKAINKLVNYEAMKSGDYWAPDDRCFRMIQKCVIGGISHVGHSGKHAYGIKSYDATSLYPTTLISHEGQEEFEDKFEPSFPKGPAIETTIWVRGKIGFYHIKNISVPRQEDRDRLKIGCIPGRMDDGRLDWAALDFPEAHVGSVDMETMEKNGYVFEVVSGIYWEESWMPFEAIVKPFMVEKIRQDWLAKNDTENYNPALREACKLILNSLYGALLDQGENKSIEDITDTAGMDHVGTRIVYNDRILLKSKVVKEFNNSIQFGAWVLVLSRQVVQGYANLIGRHNIVVTETDSFYVAENAVMTLEESRHPVWRMGNNFGNLKLEHEGLVDMIAAAKKCYSALKAASARDISPGKTLVYSLRDGTPERTVKVVDAAGDKVIVRLDDYDSEVHARDLYVHKCAFKGMSNPIREDFVHLLNHGHVTKIAQNFSRTLFVNNQRTGIHIGFRAKTARQDSRNTYKLYTHCTASGPVSTETIREAPGAPEVKEPAPARPAPAPVEVEVQPYTETVNIDNVKRLLSLTRAELAEALRKEFDDDYEEDVVRNGRAYADKRRADKEKGKLSNVKKYCQTMVKSNGILEVKYGYAKIKGTDLRRTNGRLYSVGSAMQGMPATVRGFLLEGIEAHDHDMVNAHPTIALQIAREHGLATPTLERFVSNRAEFLATTGASKVACLVMLNKDSESRNRHPLVRRLGEEFRSIQAAVFSGHGTKYHHIIHDNRENMKGSYLNQELCARENMILQHVLESVGHAKVSFLAFDGMMLSERVPLSRLNELTSQWGIKWSIKAHSQELSQTLRGH